MAPEHNSPCTGRCFLHAESLTCTGCYRTLEEITNWQEYSKEEKELVLKKIKTRKTEFI